MEKIIDNKKLIIKSAKMSDCLELFSYVSRKASILNLKLQDVINDINSNIIKIVTLCLGDKEGYDIALKICSNCIFNNEKITINLFEEEDNRQYFFEVIFEVLKYNFNSFFKKLIVF